MRIRFQEEPYPDGGEVEPPSADEGDDDGLDF